MKWIVENTNIRTGGIVCLCVFFAGFIVIFPLTDTDIWWHINSGRQMISTWSILRVDPFTFTPAVTPWINVHWLYQVCMYGLFCLGGAPLLVVSKAILFAATVAILFFVIPFQKTPLVRLGVFCLAFFEIRYLLDVRPISITIFFIAIFLFCLERFRTHKKKYWLIVLVPVQVCWVSMQGLFGIGPVLAGIYLIGALVEYFQASHSSAANYTIDLKKTFFWLMFFTGLIVTVNMINPNGYHVFLLSAKLFSRIEPLSTNLFSHTISENVPLSTLFTVEPRLALSFVVLALCTVCGMVFYGKNRNPAHVLLVIAFGVLACMAKRNILLFFIVAVPILSSSIVSIVSQPTFFLQNKRRVRTIALVFLGISIGASTIIHAKEIAGKMPEHWVAQFSTPTDAVTWLNQHPIDGNIFNTDRFGGYLEYASVPSKKVFIDDRLVLKSPAFFNSYLQALEHKAAFDSLCKAYAITHALVQTAVFNRALPLTNNLLADPAWRLVYADGIATIFTHDSTIMPRLDLASISVCDSIAHTLEHKHDNRPEIVRERLLYFGLFLVNINLPANAQMVFARRLQKGYR